MPTKITEMLKIGIILGSTRPNRVGEQVAKWVYEIAIKRSDAEFVYLDIRAYELPLLDEANVPAAGKYAREHTLRWAAAIEPLDGFVFVTPEYNHGTSASLKNAIDFLYREWNNKSAGFVSYGRDGGVRAVEQLRQTMGTLQVADVKAQVILSTHTDFEERSIFKPAERKESSVNKMLDQVIAWAGALQALRNKT